jgi:hypothetical protein
VRSGFRNSNPDWIISVTLLTQFPIVQLASCGFSSDP